MIAQRLLRYVATASALPAVGCTLAALTATPFNWRLLGVFVLTGCAFAGLIELFSDTSIYR